MDPTVVQEIVAEIGRMPLWALIGLTLFAVTAVVMLFGPSVAHRRYRRRFDTLARAVGAQPPAGRGWPVSFALEAAGRRFEIRHDYRVTGRFYRGPSGHLLITETRLAARRWEMHQVDFVRLDSFWARLFARQLERGLGPNTSFGVREDGVPVRDGWLDDDTRAAVAQFLADAPPLGTVWIKEGRLSYLLSAPWTGVDGTRLQGLLGSQAELATALERTARGPTDA